MVKSHRKGFIHLLVGQWTKYALQLVSLVVLSRLLLPSEFGLIAMVTAVTGIALVLGDFGLSLAAIRAPVLSRQQKSNLWWFNTVAGLVLGLGVFAASPLIAVLYHDDRLILIARMLSVSFFFAGMTVQFKVEMNRKGYFGRLAIIDVVSPGVGLAAAVCAAICGAGVWSLVIQSLVISFTGLVFSIIFAKWVPAFWRFRHGTAGALRFGAITSLAQVINYASVNISAIVIGRYGGEIVLGLYNRAFQLVALPVQQIAAPLTRIMLPLLSRRVGDPVSFGSLVFSVQLVLGYLLVGAISFIAAVAVPGTVLALGPDWAGAGHFVQILSVGASFQALGYVYYWSTLAAGRASLLFWVELPGRIVAVILVLVLGPVSPYLAALGSSVGLGLIWCVSVWLVPPKLNIARGPLLVSASRILPLFFVASVAGALAATLASNYAVGFQLLAAAGGWVIVVLPSMLISDIRRDVIESVMLVRTRHV